MLDMLFTDADEYDRYHNKKYEEYTQGKKQVSLVCVDVFSELLEHDLIYLVAVLLALISVPNRWR